MPYDINERVLTKTGNYIEICDYGIYIGDAKGEIVCWATDEVEEDPTVIGPIVQKVCYAHRMDGNDLRRVLNHPDAPTDSCAICTLYIDDYETVHPNGDKTCSIMCDMKYILANVFQGEYMDAALLTIEGLRRTQEKKGRVF